MKYNMAASCQIILLTTLLLFLRENAQCTKDFPSFFRRRNKSWRQRGIVKRANTPTPTAKDKETNKLVLAALYGGLGQGIPSAENFDYANSLNAKIQGAGGYGLPPGIYSYAFDPTTGMPFMCDPTKTPPGASKSQTSGAAAINPPAASKPASDQSSEELPSENAPSENAPSEITPSENTPSALTGASSQDIHPSSASVNKTPGGTNIVGTKLQPEHRLSPIGHTPSSHDAQNYVSPAPNPNPNPNSNPTTLSNKQKTTAAPGNDDDLMTSSSPSNNVHDGVTPTPNQGKATSAVTNQVASHKPATISPQPESTGNKAENQVSNDASNRVQPFGVASASEGGQVKLGAPLYVTSSEAVPQSSAPSKDAKQGLTPLIDNYHKELKEKRSNTLKKYFRTKKSTKKNDITIKLPEIPACPDMKNYHWPWNCLEKGKTVKKECIQNLRGTFSYKGAQFPYEDYGQSYEYSADENGNYYDKKE